MTILTEGHKYIAENFEDRTAGQTIQFIEKVPVEPGSTELGTVNDGTTNEEVIKILIDRIKFLNAKFACKENACCITHLEEGLHWLEARTANRMKREAEGKALL